MERRMRGATLAAVMALASVASQAGGQIVPASPRPPRPPRPPRVWMGGETGVAKIDTVVPFAANGTIDLSLVAGSIKVTTWDRSQVRVIATTSGDATLQFDASSSHLSLDQSGRRSSRNGGGSATYDVTVPSGVRASLSSVSGSVQASGVRGSVDVNVVSGRVEVRDLGSSLNVEGVSGDVTASGIASDARVGIVSGRISLSQVGGSVNAETVSGGISLNGIAGDRVHATTVSGNIDIAASPARAGRYDFETHSGRTDIRLGSNANATVSVETFSGSVSNDFPGAVRRANSDPDENSTNYNYVIGSGSARVRVETFSGTVHITRGNP
ncbi:MAG: DUF4097 domain-containing protein [Gemmatimonadota bacterium]|nr:DUF4097 domain-containing protein [Gemmatimonadota bacterium]